jgi:hypothetical protein
VTPELITRYTAPVPRYTSYPTAPHFHENFWALLRSIGESSNFAQEIYVGMYQ